MSRMLPRTAALCFLLSTLPNGSSRADDAYFTTTGVPEIRITLSEAAKKSLREKQREYTVCTLVENGGAPLQEFAIKLKGAAGSFRGLDDRPAITLNSGRYIKGREFHGMRKFHLNNSAQDGTLLHEYIGSALFTQAGCPVAKVGWARLKLDGRDMGIYVLKEGLDQNFLKRQFPDPSGNLYDGGFCQEIDAALELDEGADSKNANPPRADLKAVVTACREPDAAKRQAALEKLVDIDSLFTFMAMELMLCHWDGYTGNKNNYRVYFDPKKANQMRFLPHGMDQLLGDINYPVWGHAPALVPATVMGFPKWRKAYGERLVKLRPLFDAKNTDAIIDRALTRLGPAAKAQGGDNALRQHTELGNQMKNRLKERATVLDRLIKEIPFIAVPPTFDTTGVATLKITDWMPQKATADARVLPAENGDSLEIAVGPSKNCIASWRAPVLLPKGNYRLETRLKPEGLVSADEGAGIRISGAKRTNKLAGNSDWKLATHDFTVANENQEVVMVAEMRATAGRLLIDPKARIVRIK